MARKGSGQTVITAAEQVQVGKSIEVLLLTSVRYVTIAGFRVKRELIGRGLLRSP
jgi:hypothetical protein